MQERQRQALQRVNSGGGRPSPASKPMSQTVPIIVQVTPQLRATLLELESWPALLLYFAARLRSLACELDALTQVQWSAQDTETGGATPSSAGTKAAHKPARPPASKKSRADAGHESR